jgi:hypothetical protein
MPCTDDHPRAVVVLVIGDHEVPLAIVDRTTRCDLALVDEILRLQIVVGRRGWSIRLTAVDDDLRTLIELAGVSDRVGL